jgi:hypothetical protein
MVDGCTRERVSIDGEYSGDIFDTDLSAVPGDLYTVVLTRPRVTCHHFISQGLLELEREQDGVNIIVPMLWCLFEALKCYV